MNMSTAPAALTSQAQWKRVFLKMLVASLTTCALVAVVTLLAGQFNRTTSRILLTLGFLAFHSGMAMSCVTAMERRQWPGLARFGLILFFLNFMVAITAIWWSEVFSTPFFVYEQDLRAILGTMALAGFFVLAIPCSSLFEQRRHILPSLAGLVLCVAGLAMSWVCIWSPDSQSDAFAKATGVVAVAAFSLAHICLLLRMAPTYRNQHVLEWTVVAIGLFGAMWGCVIIWEIDVDLYYRFLGAVGVLDASGSLMLFVLARLNHVTKLSSMDSTPARLDIHCPRCTLQQTVEAGKSRCSDCGLKFTIDIEEPRCTKCDYLLWQLPQRKCPECGTDF